MELLKRGGRAKMQTIQAEDPIEVRWHLAKPDALLYTEPTAFRHRYYGTVATQNVCSDCDGRENAPHDGIGMLFPFEYDPCGCPDWYPKTPEAAPADCPGVAAAGTVAVGQTGAVRGVDPIFTTGEGGNLACCRPIPLWVGTEPTILDPPFINCFLKIPLGEPGDLLVAALRFGPPIAGVAVPAGWNPYIAETGTLTAPTAGPPQAMSWRVFWKFATTFGGEEELVGTVAAGFPQGYCIRYRYADSPFAHVRTAGPTAKTTWGSVPLKPGHVSSILLTMVTETNVFAFWDDPSNCQFHDILPEPINWFLWTCDGLAGAASGIKTARWRDLNGVGVNRPWVAYNISLPSKP